MDFTTLIKNELANGVSLEDLAKSFTNALNKAEAENAETNKRKEKETYLNQIKAKVKACITGEKYDTSLAAQILVLAAAARFSDWTVEDLKDYYECLIEPLREIDTLFNNMVNHTGPEWKVFETLDECLNSLFGVDSSDENDDSALRKFLKRFEIPR